jgi:hypothetical protein
MRVDISDAVRPASAPVACTLDTGEQETRLHQWRELTREGLISGSRDGQVMTTVWQRRGDVPERLTALIEAERLCCAFLSFEVEEFDEVVRVRTIFPQGAEGLVEFFAEQLSANK